MENPIEPMGGGGSKMLERISKGLPPLPPPNLRVAALRLLLFIAFLIAITIAELAFRAPPAESQSILKAPPTGSPAFILVTTTPTAAPVDHTLPVTPHLERQQEPPPPPPPPAPPPADRRRHS